MDELNQILGFAGLAILLIGLFGSVFERTFLAGPLAAMLAGLVLGPVTGILDPQSWPFHDRVVEQVARLTLAFSLVEVAMRLPAGTVRRLGRTLVVLVGGVMFASWVVTAVLLWWLLDTPPWIAATIGAVLAPTDPVIASAIVNGRVARDRVPETLRLTLSTESGLNDGLALAFVMLPIIVLQHGAGEVLPDWLGRVVVWEVGAAVLAGAAMGWGAGRLWSWAEGRERLDPPTILMYSLALGLVVLGLGRLIGSDAVLAVFVAGLLFDRQISEAAAEEEPIQQAVTRFFTIPVFVVLGVFLPLDAWRDMGWMAAAVPAAVLLLRRLPAVFLLAPLAPELRTRAAKLFMGWFGPVGVASIFYAFMASRELGRDGIWDVASLVIASSVVVHGLTATWAANHFPERD